MPRPPRAPIALTAFDVGTRFVGIREAPGKEFNNPQILAMLKLDMEWPSQDEVAWCSAFVNYCFWFLHLARSKSLLARSWLTIGELIDLETAVVGFDVVVLARGAGPHPRRDDPEYFTAPGHVGLYAGHADGVVNVLGGNQSNSVTVAGYPVDRILGVRRI